MERNLLRQKIGRFIHKYYLNQLLRGALLGTALGLSLFLTIALLEYFGRFGSITRAMLFFVSIVGFGSIAYPFIIQPILGLFKLSGTLSYEAAAEIIGKHFPDISDKLLNTLQLEEMEKRGEGNSLLEAAIVQKTAALKPIPFQKAIDLRLNKRYLKYTVVPIVLLVLLWWGEPEAIRGSTERIISFNKEFKPDVGFDLRISNALLQAVENDDYVLEVSAEGKVVPEAVYLVSGPNRYRLDQLGTNRYAYVFKHVRGNMDFYLESSSYQSSVYTLEVLARPTLLHMEMRLVYPSYLGLAPEVIRNQGDLVIPQGTTVSWTFKTRETDSLWMRISDAYYHAKEDRGVFTFSKRFMETEQYVLFPQNKHVGKIDSQGYEIKVNPDRAPTVLVKEVSDSVLPTQIYVLGRAEDDYGIKSVKLRYAKGVQGKERPEFSVFSSLSLSSSGTELARQFAHSWDLMTLNLKGGETLWYFVEAWDNDGVNGSKPGRSSVMQWRMPTREEIDEMRKNATLSVMSGLQASLNEAKQIQEDIQSLRNEMLQRRDVTWQQKEALRNLIEKQNTLQENIERQRKMNQEKNLRDKQLSSQEQDILDKQKKLEEILDKINTESLQKFFDELEKSMERQDRQKMQELLEKMEMSNEDVSKELDRSLELFKQMAVEQQMRDVLNTLEMLQKSQTELMNTASNLSKEEKAQKQEELKLEFEKLQESIREMEMLNKELSRPNELPDTKGLEEEIKKHMEEGAKELKEGQEQKARKSQQQSKQKMNKMQEQLSEAMEMQQAMQQEEDMEALRLILNNLVQLSFSQEELMLRVKSYSRSDPRMREDARNQRKLLEDAKIIEDSLQALANRVPEIESIVMQEIRNMRRDLSKGMSSLAEQQVPMALQRQQGAMTAANNLALMLSEVLEQMQASMGMGMAGSSACKKPGSGMSPQSMSDLMQRQAGLEKKMQELMEKMRKEQAEKMGEKPGQRPGEKPGDKSGEGQKPSGSGDKPGNEGKEGEGGEGGQGSKGDTARRLAELAAEQEQIRRELQGMMKNLNEPGRKMAGEAMKKMEENETDILNRKLSEQTLRRQREITQRLLESNKALREQEEDEKREGNENKRIFDIQQQKMEEYFRSKDKEQEWLRTIPPAMKPYYKQKVTQFFNTY